MKALKIITFLFSFCTTVYGLWFSSSKSVTPSAEVSEECVGKAVIGECSFYDCFDERFPCGNDGYALSYGKKYCDKFQQNQNMFTPAGFDFINKMTRCHTNNSLSTYRQNQLECFAHYDLSFEIMGECYVSSGFCEVVVDNFMTLARIIDPPDFVNYRLIREVFKAAKLCPNDITSQIITKYLSYRRRSLL